MNNIINILKEPTTYTISFKKVNQMNLLFWIIMKRSVTNVNIKQ